MHYLPPIGLNDFPIQIQIETALVVIQRKQATTALFSDLYLLNYKSIDEYRVRSTEPLTYINLHDLINSTLQKWTLTNIHLQLQWPTRLNIYSSIFFVRYLH